MLAAFALIVVSVLPRADVLRESVDLIEVNHFYNENGSHIFDQAIFWDWSTSDERFHVRDWRTIKSPEQVPSRDHQWGGYSALWADGSVVRQIWSTNFRETWAQVGVDGDPELNEREILPKESRKGLLKILFQRPQNN
jgi:hypothetical protein